MNKKIVSIISGVTFTTLGGYGLYKGFINKSPLKYSPEWIEGLTSKQWENEREKLQQVVMSPKYADSLRIEARKIIELFDKIKNKKEWKGFANYKFPVHGEHGTNLYKK